MRQRIFIAGLAVWCTLHGTPSAQGWTVEELDSRIQGFLEEGALARLEQIGRLVEAQGEAGRAIAARIHGDHREYLLKVERLVDQLTDERWVERERAERTLIEIGGRARELLRQRGATGELLEERHRCKRIVDEISARGTEKEEQESQMLRGLVATALYLDSFDRLTRSLLSALGHTDPKIVEGAVRGLGVHGQGEHAHALRPVLDRSPNLRRVALASIARMRGREALTICSDLLRGDAITLTEKMMVIRALRARPDSAAVLRGLTDDAEPLLAAAASLELPAPDTAPVPVQLTLSDRTVITQPFLGMNGEGVVIGSPAKGLKRVELSFDECQGLDFAAAPRPAAPGVCRVFLTQGSLVTGKLLRMTADALLVQSAVFGGIEIPRTSIQGIALDPKLDRLIGASTKIDRLRLRNQELVDGTILSMSEAEVTLAGPDGGELRYPMADVAGILLTRPLQAPPDDALYTRIDLATGDRILGHVVGVNEGSLAVVAPLLGSTIIPVRNIGHLELEVSGGALWGFTLIADYSDNRLVEVDEQGKEVFVMEDIYGAWDVECLDNGNLLITEFSVSRVQEVTRKGDPVWSFEDLRNPYDADRLPNGNTLIADTFRGRVIEVDKEGKEVWSYADGIRPFDVDRLPNGNTLIADVLKDRVIEIDRSGKIVWEKKDLPSVHDADRLPNGHTLITLRTLNRVIEVDRSGKEVFRLTNLNAPSDADRLPNGHTIVAENNMVREFDRNGNVVWRKEMTWAVEVNRY